MSTATLRSTRRALSSDAPQFHLQLQWALRAAVCVWMIACGIRPDVTLAQDAPSQPNQTPAFASATRYSGVRAATHVFPATSTTHSREPSQPIHVTDRWQRHVASELPNDAVFTPVARRQPKRQEVLGSRRPFYTRRISAPTEWRTLTATLLAQTPSLNVWIADDARAQLADTDAPETVADSLATLLTSHLGPFAGRTGFPDLDDADLAHEGVLDRVTRLFGAPPDVDGSGRVDLLLLDVRDGYTGSGGYVAGFFDPNDLTDSASSNRRDMLYVDVWPTMVRDGMLRYDEAVATVAHELQHLIHAPHGGVDRELTFVNEGLSEVAEIACGFAPRPAGAYLSDSFRSLASWTYDDALPDYARASLFTHYLFETIGTAHVRSLVTSPEIGLAGYDDVLRRAGRQSVRELFAQWGRDLASPTGPSAGAYRHPARRHVRLRPVSTAHVLPSALTVELPPLTHAVFDFPLTASLTPSVSSAATVDLDAVVRYPDRPDVHVRPVAPSQTIEASEAPHGGISLLVRRLDLQAPDTSRARVSLLFSGRRSGQTRMLSYDDGQPDPFYGAASYLRIEGPDEAIALPFSLDDTAWLHAVSTQVLFDSELSSSSLPPSADRDFIVEIRRSEEGRPGALMAPPVHAEAGRPFGSLVASSLSLIQHHDALGALSGAFFVVLRNDADDANDLAVALDRNGASAFRNRGDGRWEPLSKSVVGTATLDGFAPLLRAHVVLREPEVFPWTPDAAFAYDGQTATITLLGDDSAPGAFDLDRSGGAALSPTREYLPVSVEQDGERTVARFTPDGAGTYRVRLAMTDAAGTSQRDIEFTWTLRRTFDVGSPYPNPSRGRVTVPTQIYGVQRVQMVVYDVLGRRVKAFSPRRLPHGTPSLSLDLSALAAGTYFVRFTSEGPTPSVRTARVVLIR